MNKKTAKKIKKKFKKTKHKLLFGLFWTAVVFLCGVYVSAHKEEVEGMITGHRKKR